jgi:hypothetical protein
MSLKITSAIFASMLSLMSYGQEQRAVVCRDNAVNEQLVSLDNGLEERGFKLVKYQMITMPSGSLVPVTVTLEKDKMYQINFIANKDYQQYTITLVDKDRKKWMDKKIKQKDNKGMFTESFAAPESGEYYIILTQKVKGMAEACGGISVLKAVNDHLPYKK